MSEWGEFHCFGAKGFCSNMGDTKCPCVCRRMMPEKGVHSENVRETGKIEMSQRRSNRQLTVCSLFWLRAFIDDTPQYDSYDTVWSDHFYIIYIILN